MFLQEYDLSKILFVLSLPGSSPGSVRFYFFFGVFPYFLLLLFLFLPFLLLYLFLSFRGSTRPGADDETFFFESNRNIFLFSSAHDIHSVIRFESAAMFKAEPRLSG